MGSHRRETRFAQNASRHAGAVAVRRLPAEARLGSDVIHGQGARLGISRNRRFARDVQAPVRKLSRARHHSSRGRAMNGPSRISTVATVMLLVMAVTYASAQTYPTK